MTRASIALLAALMLVACSEKPQTASARKSDEQAWTANDSAYAAPGFKAGDKTAWEQQLKARSAGQNEYSRAATP
jgi:uncharacterized protein YcfL